MAYVWGKPTALVSIEYVRVLILVKINSVMRIKVYIVYVYRGEIHLCKQAGKSFVASLFEAVRRQWMTGNGIPVE